MTFTNGWISLLESNRFLYKITGKTLGCGKIKEKRKLATAILLW